MIKVKNIKQYCCEDISNIENYEQAKNSHEIWDCHHRAEVLPCGNFSREDLKKFGLYWNRPADELIFMTHAQHAKIHSTGKHYMLGKHLSAEHRLNISTSNKGKKVSESTKKKISASKKGKHLSDFIRQKISASIKGKHWYNNGLQELQAHECPIGFKKGRL